MKILIKIFLPAIILTLNAAGVMAGNNFNRDSIYKMVIYQPVQVKLGLTSGWKAPHGTGIDFSLTINELVDINLGAGISISGTKIGVGARLYPLREKDFSPMIGAFLYHSGGMERITVTYNYDEAVYRINPNNAFQINAGARYRFGKGHYFIGALGYAFPFNKEGAEYINGSTLDTVRSVADAITIGGFAVYGGILIKLTPGNYRIPQF